MSPPLPTLYAGICRCVPLSLIFRFSSSILLEPTEKSLKLTAGRIWTGMEVDPVVLFFRALSKASGFYLSDFFCIVPRKKLSHHNLQPSILGEYSKFSESISDAI